MADRKGIAPSWGEKAFPKDARDGRFVVLASGRDEPEDADALRINSDARVLGATLKAGETVRYDLGGRKGYLVPATGKVSVDGHEANARDGVAIADVAVLEVTALEDAELVLVDS
jgi:redox-sensitive bicupin YhaK (pirin superfamily)